MVATRFIGARLATAHNLVVVTTNYRLGVFGWFSQPALQSGDPADDSGNDGTLDLVECLSISLAGYCGPGVVLL